MSYIVYAFIAAFCFAFSQIVNKLLSKHSIDNADSLMTYFMMASFFFGLFLTPFVSLDIPSPQVLGIIIIMVTTFLTGYYLFYHGVFQADASTFSPLFQLQAGLIAILAYFFLGERFPLQNYFWVFIMILGAIFVSFNENMSPRKFLNRGVLLIILMQVIHSVSNLFVGYSLKYLPPLEVLFWFYLMIGLILGPFILIRKPNLNYPVKQVIPMYIGGFISGSGAVALLIAYTQNLTITSAISLMSSPIVFVFSLFASRFFPQLLEHHSAKVYAVRGIGLAVIVVGAYMVSAG